MDRTEVVSLLSQLATYWENRSTDYHDYKSHDLQLRYMNACAEAVVLLEQDERMEDDGK